MLEVEHDDFVRMDMGDFDDLLKVECACHAELLDRLSKELSFQENRGELIIWRGYSTTSLCVYTPITSTHGRYDSVGATAQVDVEIDEKKGNQSFAFGKRLDPQWTHTTNLVDGYNSCLSQHDTCHQPQYLSQIPSLKPLYFIDTAEMCLIPAQSGTSYIALSYVWGSIEILKTTKTNMKQLQQPGSLKDPKVRPSLPRTVRQAIRLVRVLGERYLWLDTLCIVQDDIETFKNQIQQMASIYAHARAVVVAADGADANYGLRGLRELEDAEPRCVEQITINFGQKTLLKRLQIAVHTSGKLEQKYWNRGWTFQEWLFARHRICFQSDSVKFECCKSIQHEEHARPERVIESRD